MVSLVDYFVEMCIRGASDSSAECHKNYLRLVAHNPTAALSTNCLQLRPALGIPFSAPMMLGQAGFTAPAAAAAYRALIVGRYRLNAVQERYVSEPERS